MRRFLILFAVLSAACARSTWEGTQGLTRDVQATPDAIMAAASRALGAHGYRTQMVPANHMVVTAPHALPEGVTPTGANRDSLPRSWVIQVQALKNDVVAGSKISVAAFLVPRALEAKTGTSAREGLGIPVTSAEPQLLREVRRVGDWIVDETRRSQ